MSQTGRAASAFVLMPMKRQRLPIWLLRDVPALMGLLASFWTLVIFAMTRRVALTRGAKAFRDHFALLLALAEARLDYALWRQAYRRIGWHPRSVTLQIPPPNTAWSDTQTRLQNYAHVFRNMNQVVDAYVDHIRECFGIAEREAVSAGRCPVVSVSCAKVVAGEPHAPYGLKTRGAATALAGRRYIQIQEKSVPLASAHPRLRPRSLTQRKTPEGAGPSGVMLSRYSPDQLKPIQRPPAAVATQLRIDITAIIFAIRPLEVASSL